MNINQSKLLGGVLALVVVFGGVGLAGATLTMDGTSITGTSNITINGVASSVYTIGAATTTGTITIGGTSQTGAINIGHAAATPVNIGGSVYVNGGGAGTAYTSTSAGDVVSIQASLTSATDGTSNGDSLLAGYFKVANSADMTKRQLQGVLSSVTMANDVFAAYGVQGHVAVADGASATGSTGNGNIAGVSGKVSIAGTTTAGVVSAGLFTIDGAGTATNANGIWIDAGGATNPVKNGILISGNITNDITLSSGAAILTGSLTNPDTSNLTCPAVGSLYLSTGTGGTTWHCTVAGVGAASTWVEISPAI